MKTFLVMSLANAILMLVYLLVLAWYVSRRLYNRIKDWFSISKT